MDELGELGVDPEQSEQRPPRLGHVGRHRVALTGHDPQLCQQPVVLGVHDELLWTVSPACPVRSRSFFRQRMRVGPMAPTGIPSASDTSA